MKILNLDIKDPLIKGHPLHAILTDLPVGALVAGTTFDLIGLATRQPKWRFAARAAHTGAFISGCGTALVGLWDYQAVPTDHPARRVGAIHGYLNAAMMSLLGSSLLLRREAKAPASGRPSTLAVIFSTVGGALLCYLGLRTLLAKPASAKATAHTARPVRDKRGLAGAYFSTVGLTLTNPATILSFAAVFAGLGLVGAAGSVEGAPALLTAGVAFGSACWWLLLSGGVSLLRARLAPGALRWVNWLSGLLLLGFGVVALASGFVGMLSR